MIFLCGIISFLYDFYWVRAKVSKYEKMEQAFIPSLHDSIFEALESYSPREVKRLLIRAMAYAAYRKQRTIGLDINADDLRLPAIDEVRMGFLS